MKKTFIDADFELIVLENCVMTSSLNTGGNVGGLTGNTDPNEWDEEP